jgi:hypothetical protein
MPSLPDDVPVALLRCTTDGSVTAANQAWCDLARLAPEDSLGHGWLAVLDPADQATVLAAIWAATGRNGRVETELTIAGRRRRASWLIRCSHDATGVVMAVVEPDAVHPHTSRYDVTQGPSVLPPEVTTRVVHDLYAVSLSLAPCIALVDDPAADRLSRAIEQLDEVISRLRVAIVGEQSSSSATPRPARIPGTSVMQGGPSRRTGGRAPHR